MTSGETLEKCLRMAASANTFYIASEYKNKTNM